MRITYTNTFIFIYICILLHNIHFNILSCMVVAVVLFIWYDAFFAPTYIIMTYGTTYIATAYYTFVHKK